MKLLFDADMLIYRMCSACQENSPFNPELVIKACPIETWDVIQQRVKQCVDLVTAEFDTKVEVVMCLSPSGKTFRYDIFPDYKANRKDTVRPILLGAMNKKLKEEYHVEEWANLEADDVLGILADGENTIICSGDKDLRQISTYHLSLAHPEFVEWVTPEEGYKFFLKQCIAGDSVDGYRGVGGIGIKKAEKILETEGYDWETVVHTYESAMTPKTIKGEKVEPVSQGLTEEDALMTARLAYILQKEEEYNEQEARVEYWNPSDRNWRL